MIIKHRRKRKDFGIDSILRKIDFEGSWHASVREVKEVEKEVLKIKKNLLLQEELTQSKEERLAFLELEVKQLDLLVTLLLGKLIEKNILSPEELHSLIEISNPESDTDPTSAAE